MIARLLAFVAFERYLGRNFMTRPLLVCLVLIACVLCGCDNRTRDDKVFDQIAATQKSDKGAQPFKEAEDPWSSAEHHKGLAW
jgi:hypothetical protein